MGILGKIVKARQEHICDGCGKPIKKGEQYDYCDGYSATYRNEIGEKERKYYQCRFHLECGNITYDTHDSFTIDDFLNIHNYHDRTRMGNSHQ